MTVVAVASASGSPGVTTIAYLLALGRADRPILIEASPFGGGLAARADLHWNPGVASLAATARDEIPSALLAEHLQTTATGLVFLAGPSSSIEAGPALNHVLPLIERAMIRSGWNLVIDCGTLWPASPAWPLSISADITVLVMRQHAEDPHQTAARVSHLCALAASLNQAGAAVVVALVGSRPYSPGEVAAAVGAEVVAVIPEDRAAVASLLAPERRRNRNKLVEAVEHLNDELMARSDGDTSLLARFSSDPDSGAETSGHDPAAPRERAGRWS